MAATEGTVYAMVLGKVILALREKRGLTQQALAETAALTQSTVSRIERGLSQPDAYTMGVLAEALGLSLNELNALVDDAMKRTEKAAGATVNGAGRGTWWKVALGVAGVAGLAGLVGFAVATALEQEQEEDEEEVT